MIDPSWDNDKPTIVERTPEAQRGFDAATANPEPNDAATKPRTPNMTDEELAAAQRTAAHIANRLHTPDPFADDTPIACGVENPDICESCQ